MEIEKLNQAIVQILEKRTELSALAYSDDTYDDVEEALHDLEDDFIDQHGSQLEKALKKVHKEYCSESDVLLPTSYLPKVVKIVNNEFEFSANEGVLVEMDDMPALEARLIMLPNPPQIMLLTPGETLVVWSAENEK